MIEIDLVAQQSYSLVRWLFVLTLTANMGDSRVYKCATRYRIRCTLMHHRGLAVVVVLL